MKHYKYFLKTAVSACVFLLVSSAAAQKGPKETFTHPKLNDIRMPEVHKVTLPNGLRLLLVEDHTFPVIDMRAQIYTGSVFEPSPKTGLASITGTVIRSGGSEKYPGDELDAMLETLAASISTSIGQTSGSASLSVLKEDFSRVLTVFADLLMHPAFPEEKLELAKIEHRSAISRRNDDMGQIAGREFAKLIYGSDSPYARHTEYETIAAITRDDLIDFHGQYFDPDNMIMAVWGDFKWKAMKKQIEQAFSGWKKSAAPDVALPAAPYTFDTSVNYIEKTDVNQAMIYFGHKGGLLNNPDYPALLVMNQILSFQRLFKRVRTNEGLAYSVGSSFGAGYRVPGMFTCTCQTKSESAVKALQLMIDQIRLMQDELVSEQELEQAKNGFLNSFVFGFDSKAKIVGRYLSYAFNDYPENFNTITKDAVEEITREDVRNAAQKYLRPDQLRILVVGNEENFDQPLSVLGDVNRIDISIPSPPSEAAPEADAESIARAREIIGRTIEAIGGMELLSTVKNLQINSRQTMMGMELNSLAYILYPDKYWTSFNIPGGSLTMGLSGGSAWMQMPGQDKAPMPAQQKAAVINSLRRDLINLFAYNETKTIQYMGTRAVQDKEVLDVLVVDGDTRFSLLINPETYLPAALSYREETTQGPAEAIEYLSDYKEFAGIKFPTKTVVTYGGQTASQSEIETVEINVEIDTTLFE